MPMQTPQRGHLHDQLKVFLGDWRAEGVAHGPTDQPGDDPQANDQPWTSTHTGRWHTGEFYLIQDERAVVGGSRFETLGIMGVDETGAHFAQTFDNGGFSRRYKLVADGATWHISGPTERATIVFSDDGRTQTITWEWKPEDVWLPLCDRVATRNDL